MNKSAALCLDDHSKDTKGKPHKPPSNPPYQKDKPTCKFCHNEGHTEDVCRKKKLRQKTGAEKGGKYEKPKPKMGGTDVLALVANHPAKTPGQLYVLDSGASIHASHDHSAMTDLRPCQEIIQRCGTGTPLIVKEIGTLSLRLKTNTGGELTLKFKDTYYSKDFSYNLISVSKLLENGHSVSISSKNHGISIQKEEI